MFNLIVLFKNFFASLSCPKFLYNLFPPLPEIKKSVRKKYPSKFRPYPTDNDYKTGTIKRYFTQKANNLNGDLFEISEEDYGVKHPLFRYVKINWIISGKKSEVIRVNLGTINFISRRRGNEILNKKLFPLQFWRPDKNSIDDLQKKLSLLKTY